ncbi:MAG: carboxylesterase family protein [Synergistaceae bacterium]|jgi:para-nitrobenzyl esterase|nr:carboxylesterase family protein [Synergistaceae bacterium]
MLKFFYCSKFLIVALLALSVVSQGRAYAASVTLKTPSGEIRGALNEGVSVYKGIPYAMPPVGELKFAPPQDMAPWEGERDCTEFAPQAIQYMPLAGQPMSENCLALNVWTPVLPGDDAKLPVYVFIHGGGFAEGTSSMPMYDGTGFAKKGIVTVTINYRLNTLGFFASQETLKRYGTTGNWGILDQIKALEWVKKNISAFGGDPDSVTIGGESAGSFSVSILMTSPLAKGLFRGAILESGTILSLPFLSAYARSDLEKSITVSGMLAGIFGAGDDETGLERMRRANSVAMANLSAFTLDQTVPSAFLLIPVFDGRVIPKNPVSELSSGNFNCVNTLIGFNNDEGSLFVPTGTDEGQYMAIAAKILGYEKSLVALERFKVEDRDAQKNATQRARQITAYGVFSAGAKRYADLVTKAGGDVYMYKFKTVTPDDLKNGLGARHAAELPFVFDTLGTFGTSGLRGTEYDKIAEEMHTRWANFIKNGDPNVGESAPSGVKWPKYDPANADVIYFDRKITSGALEDRENIDFMISLIYDSK